ncbi:hypothetical protein SAMN05444745_1571 [Arthrobacter sp. OV608]|nr:hypothetical protein SAMN05444745_1571 [Arthrobacter sp. OV608]
MYGAYLSWCLRNQKQPASEHAFWAAMSTQGYNRNDDTAGKENQRKGLLSCLSWRQQWQGAAIQPANYQQQTSASSPLLRTCDGQIV